MKPVLRFPEFNASWKENRLKDIAYINPKSDITKPDIINYIDLESVNGNKVTDIKRIYKEDAPSRAQRVAKYQDIFFQTVRPYQQNNFIYDFDIRNVVVSTGYAQIRVRQDAYYIFTLLHTHRFLISVLMNCTGSNYPAINGTDLSNIKVIYSSDKEEQKRIGDLFYKLNLQIELEEKKLKLLEQQKRGYMQKIFSQELRFKDENGNNYPEWKKKKLINIVTPLKGQDENINNLPVLTISASRGWLNQKERFSHIIAGKSLKKYTQVKKNDLSYNKGNSKVAKYGIVFRLENEALVPNVYKSFRPNENINSVFIEKYFHNKTLDKQLRTRITSTARTDGLLNISDQDFYNIKLYIPTLKEQIKIGNFFEKIDDLIEKQNLKIKQLKHRKKGLLQKMFI